MNYTWLKFVLRKLPYKREVSAAARLLVAAFQEGGDNRKAG